MRRSILLAALLLLPISQALSQEAILGSENQRAAGKALYDLKCAQCHGYNGDAASVAKFYFRPQPRDFTSATFKFRTTQSGDLPTHDDLKKSIRNGMPYTGMPAWDNLSDDEISNLAYYIKTFSDDFTEFGDVSPLEFPGAPGFSEASAQRGRVVYEENQCLDCHGNRGRGDGKSAPTLRDQWNQPIRPADLTKRWTFRGGSTREDIYRTFTTGLDGSPMPSYSIQPPDDQWALVDYVYSLSRDEPEYGTAVFAQGSEANLDIRQGRALFEVAEPAYFPVVGQVIEPGRAFYPGVNGIEVRAIYNEEEIAILLSWHDMTAERSGSNSPSTAVPMTDPAEFDTTLVYSDAVAIQFPAEMPVGTEKPYFLFGDTKNAVDIWFADLADSGATRLTGRGSQSIAAADSAGLDLMTRYDEGEWTAVFKRKRMDSDGLSFAEGEFIPIAFSVWDGFNQERGNKRGITSWYYLYLKPMHVESAVGPMVKYALLTFLLEGVIIFFVRRKYRS